MHNYLNRIFLAAVFIGACRTKAKETVTVQALDGYAKATKSAIRQMNGYFRCDLLIYSNDGHADITLRSEHGQPCGTVIRQEPEEQGFSATTYACGDRVEVYIAWPGHINTQGFIAAHETGHGLSHFLGKGFEHSTIGIMSKPNDPNSREQNVIRVRDADTKIANKRYCEQ